MQKCEVGGWLEKIIFPEQLGVIHYSYSYKARDLMYNSHQKNLAVQKEKLWLCY